MDRTLKILFAGTPEFAVPSLQALLTSEHQVCAVFTQPDRPAGRGRKLTASPVKDLAETAGVPVHQPSTLRDPGVQREIGALNHDLMVVAAYGLLLPRPVLEIPSLGCVNVHASLLPRWRGAAPIQWAILAGDAKTGVTIMQMDEGLDTGAMLLQQELEIHPTETAATLHDRLATLGAEVLLETLGDMALGRMTPMVQDAARVTYAPKLRKDDAWLDWDQSALELERKVRAFNPWPVSATRFRDKTLRIWAAHALPDASNRQGRPGQVFADGHGLDVACGEGRLRLAQVQLPGKRPVPVAAFLNAHSVKGVCLG
jgi:methionyl-tRNA formyltransferase